jgi:uncharacterized protein YceH (UPF0502 family)
MTLFGYTHRMDPLTPDESRILGVLIEKQMTTPDQYPLTLNSIVSGSNQKNNRDPVIEMDDDRAYSATESLREKGFVVRVEQSGARVAKYKHLAAEKLDARPAELALLAELLLRGPQTLGELRGRASRMQAFESLEAVSGFLSGLMAKQPPLVKRLPPSPGTRAEKYMQLLGEEATEEQVEDEAADAVETTPAAVPAAATGEVIALTARVSALESETAALRAAVRRLAADMGAPDPLT